MLIKEINLLATDLAATKNFYHHILELPVVSEEKDFVSLRAGTSLLTFQEAKEIKPVYHFAFNIPCNKIEEALQWVESKSIIIKAGAENKIVDFKNWNAKAFYFFDNSGNILEMIARFDLKNEIDKEFSSDLIISISEVAIVTDNVIESGNHLTHTLNIGYFDKQLPSRDFAALGDDDGLFILSQTGRNWFLTDLPSKKYSQRVTIETEGKQKEITFNH